MSRLTTNYMIRPSSNRGAAFKDWSERSKHRVGTLRRDDQVIYAPSSQRVHYLSRVSKIHTSKHDGKVYGMAGKVAVRKIGHDVWQEIANY